MELNVDYPENKRRMINKGRAGKSASRSNQKRKYTQIAQKDWRLQRPFLFNFPMNNGKNNTSVITLEDQQ